MVEGILLQNVQTREMLTLDMVSTPDFILNSVDWGVIESAHHSFKYVNQIGVHVTSTSLETRIVEIDGWIVAETEVQMAQRKAILNRFVNPQQAIDLFYKDYMIRFLPQITVRYSITIQENNEVICRFRIEGMCPDPLFAEKDLRSISAASTIPLFHFPLIITPDPDPPGGIVFGYREPSLIIIIRNIGAVPVGMEITFRATGLLTNPSLTNITTQKFFKIDKSMVAGERIVVNTSIGEKGIKGYLNGETMNYFRYRDIDSTWLQLAVGDNVLRYDAETEIDKLEVDIHFRNKFLEVQA